MEKGRGEERRCYYASIKKGENRVFARRFFWKIVPGKNVASSISRRNRKGKRRNWDCQKFSPYIEEEEEEEEILYTHIYIFLNIR